MRTREMAVVLVLGMAVGLAASGCRSRGAGAGAGGENVAGVTGTDIYSEPLSERPAGKEYESQFEPVYFDYDSSQINTAERSKIETVAEYLRQHGNVGIVVEGHCDERGSREYNMALGERRALAVRAYLIGLGIDGSRVQTKSYGEEKPVALGHDEESWRLNRRAEFVLFY